MAATEVAAVGETYARSRRTMKALVQEGRGSVDVLHLRDVPVPALPEGRVLVRMRAASVNALDWHATHGGLALDIASKVMRSREEPVRGVDLAGVVEEVGPGVTAFAPGDEVFGGAAATFAELVRARADRLLVKPAGVSFEEAATLGVAGRTALQALRDHAAVRPGQRVLVVGAGGGVGTFAVQLAKVLGAHVTAVTGPRNIDAARALGADEVIDRSKGDHTRRADRYDAVIDVAAADSVGSLLRLVAPGGVLVAVGAAKWGGTLGLFARLAGIAFRSRALGQRVRFFVAKTDTADLAYLRDLVVAGTLRPAIERTYPLSEAREAIRHVATGEARGKIVVTAG